jgi:hypothetical protein
MLANPDESKTVYNSLAKYAINTKQYDVINMEEAPHLPKFMTIIQLDKSDKSNKQMWNTDFTLTDKINDSDYYIDSLDNFLSLEYNNDLINNQYKAVIKTPNTRKDVTREYQYAQLIGKILCNTNYNKFGLPTRERYGLFTNYFLNLAGQNTSLVESIFKNIRSYQTTNPIIMDCIKNINVFNATDYMIKLRKINDVPIKEFYNAEILSRILFVTYMFKAFYITSPPNRPFYFSGRHLFETDITKNNYGFENVFLNIINLICNEGTDFSGFKYHFTELDKEIYLLKEIQKKFKTKITPNTIATKDTKCIDTMIDILNDTFAYYEKEENKLITDKESVEYEQESVPLAIEYINKIEILDLQVMRMYEFWEFEKIIIKLLDPDFYKNNYLYYDNQTKTLIKKDTAIPNLLQMHKITDLNKLNNLFLRTHVNDKSKIDAFFEIMESYI